MFADVLSSYAPARIGFHVISDILRRDAAPRGQGGPIGDFAPNINRAVGLQIRGGLDISRDFDGGVGLQSHMTTDAAVNFYPREPAIVVCRFGIDPLSVDCDFSVADDDGGIGACGRAALMECYDRAPSPGLYNGVISYVPLDFYASPGDQNARPGAYGAGYFNRTVEGEFLPGRTSRLIVSIFPTCSCVGFCAMAALLRQGLPPRKRQETRTAWMKVSFGYLRLWI